MGQMLALLAVLAAPCPGDVNGDHRVTIAELVAAVNAALDGCGGGAQATPTATARPVSPTPTAVAITGCPIRFTDDNTNDDAPSCWFDGHLPPACANFHFYGNGSMMIAAADTPDGPIYFGATVTDATHASVFGHWAREDVADFVRAQGAVSLSANGDTMTIGVFTAKCGRYDARYTEQRFPPRSPVRAMLAILGNRQ